MMRIVAQVLQRYRVAQRYVRAKGLGLGHTFQNESVRIHRFSSHIVVTDLTNAGKRGKGADELKVRPTNAYAGDHAQWLERMAGFFVETATPTRGYQAIKAFIEDVASDAPGEIAIDVRTLKAIHVEPYGEVFKFKIPQGNKASIEVKSSPTDFSVINHAYIMHPTDPSKGGFIQDTMYSPRKKGDAVAFYAWMKDNHERAKRFISIDMFRKVWDQLDMKIDSH